MIASLSLFRLIPLSLGLTGVVPRTSMAAPAQSLGAQVAVPAARATLPDSLATITTDTGAFAPGHASFARYDVPGLCHAAALDASVVLRRSTAAQAIMDTIRATAPAHDTLPSGAVAIARACGARLSLAKTTAPNLMDLFDLALFEQNDTLAHAVVQRMVALAPTDIVRETVLNEVIGRYLAAAPARVSAAESVVAQVDAPGSRVQIARLSAHAQMLSFYASTFDTERMRQEAERIIRLSHEVPAAVLQNDRGPVVQAFTALMAIAFVEHPDSLLGVAQRAKEELGRIPLPSTTAFNYRTEPVDRVLDALSPMGRSLRAVGQVPPPLEAQYWFPKRPDPEARRERPYSLFVYGERGFCLGDLRYGSDIFTGCDGLSTSKRTRLAQYAARGIAVTVVVETWPNALGVLPAPSVTKADTIGSYFRTYLKLPVTVAVVVDSMRRLPAPDGREIPCVAGYDDQCRPNLRSQESTNTNVQWYLNRDIPLVLLGRDGRLLYAGDFSPLFDAFVARITSRSSGDVTTSPRGGR